MESKNFYEKIKQHCLKTKTIDVDIKFIEFLLDENETIPENIYSDRLRLEEPETKPSNHTGLKEIPKLNKFLEETVSEFGACFLKLGAKAGMDMGNWVTELKCCSLEDVCIMLKYSDRLSDEAEQILKNNSSLLETHNQKNRVKLVFKKHYDLELSREFRVFVQNKNIKGICQRNINVCFPFLKAEVPKYEKIIIEFFEKNKNSISLENCKLYKIL